MGQWWDNLPGPLLMWSWWVSGGNSELLTPVSEWVAQRVSLLPWSGLWLGKCTSLTLSSGLEDMHRVRKVSPMWGAEQKWAVGAPCAHQVNGGGSLFLWISSTLGHRVLCLSQWRRLFGCFTLGLQDFKLPEGERNYCPWLGVKHKIHPQKIAWKEWYCC